MRRHNSGTQRLRHITVGIRIHAKTRGPRCSGVFGHHRPDFFSVPKGHRSNLSPFDAALGNSVRGVESCPHAFSGGAGRWLGAFKLLPSWTYLTMKDENGSELDALARDFPAPETTAGNDPTGRAEGESRRSQSLLHTDVEEIPDALFVKDRRGRDQLMSQLAEAQRLASLGSWNWDMESGDRTWSDELYRIFGLDRNRPAPDLNTIFSECVHPDDREFLKSSIERSMRDKESWSFSVRIIRPDGTERIIHSRPHVVTHDTNNLISIFPT